MIRIVSQSAIHQYDENERAITTWDSKKCSWIVNEEFEDEDIDWWGEDNDFPVGETLKEYLSRNPTWDIKPNITVTWTINDKDNYYKVFNEYPQRKTESFKSFGHLFQACDMKHAYEYDPDFKFPYSFSREWGYLEYNKEEAIMYLGRYCSFNKASSTRIVYNNEVIFEGKLEW